MIDGAHQYSRSGYNILIAILGAGSALGLIGPLLMRHRTG